MNFIVVEFLKVCNRFGEFRVLQMNAGKLIQFCFNFYYKKCERQWNSIVCLGVAVCSTTLTDVISEGHMNIHCILYVALK